MHRHDDIDVEVMNGTGVADDIRETVIELVSAGLEDPEAYQVVVIAAANLVGNAAGSVGEVEAAIGAIRRLAMRVHVSMAGGGEA